MSKYQKLDNALAPTMHDDDYDESFSLYADDNQQQLQQLQLQHNSGSNHIRLNSTHMPNGNPKYNYANNNNNSSSSNNNSSNMDSLRRTRADASELEEHTWEVPLLRSGSSNNSRTNLHLEPNSDTFVACHSGQPGFGANLKSKSAQEAKFKILLAISLCCIFMIIEFLGGYIAGSLAIMADAAHLASDCISFVIGLVAIWLGGRPPDARMSFGYKRFEVLGALASILGIWLLTAMLVFVAIGRIYSQNFELDVNVMMCISAIGIGINIIPERNLNLRAAMIHVIGDLVQSIGVFLAAILIKFYPSAKYVDPLCTLLFSVIVIMTTVQLFRESVSILLDAVPRSVCLATLQRELTSIEGVKSVHHLNVWQHTSEHNVLMAHLVVDLLSDSNAVLELATQLACGSKYNIKHATIQIERLTEHKRKQQQQQQQYMY
ncbi:proton-coupled zinc antiporter SLC30A2 isoform X3 [Drosophila montana]|uniref:proton-coupled zinc antiporter SLC30A2 isoform X3 n=1 Tax=Drosophila montana TaxID=40370 RepID=UPI00313B742C